MTPNDPNAPEAFVFLKTFLVGPIFEVTSSKLKGYSEVSLPINAGWLPHLVGRTPAQSIIHVDAIKGYIGIVRGQPEVKLLRNVLWPPNLVELLTRAVCVGGVKSHTGGTQSQPKVKLLRNVVATKVGWKILGRVYT